MIGREQVERMDKRNIRPPAANASIEPPLPSPSGRRPSARRTKRDAGLIAVFVTNREHYAKISRPRYSPFFDAHGRHACQELRLDPSDPDDERPDRDGGEGC